MIRPFMIIIDIYKYLDEFRSLEIEENEFFLKRESCFINRYSLGFYIECTCQNKIFRDRLYLMGRKVWVGNIQSTIGTYKPIENICMIGDILHIIIIMLGQGKMDDDL